MTDYVKNNINELFSNNSLPDYCVIVVEHRIPSGTASDHETLLTVYNGCKNMLSASYVSHYTEMNNNLIFCYLNYEAPGFSIRALVGSLRQVIYNITPKSCSNVFYSESVNSEKALLSESNFLVSALKYSPILGFSAPFRSPYLHACEDSKEKLDRSVLSYVYNSLCARKYKEIIDYLKKWASFFREVSGSEMFYSCSELLQVMEDIWYALRLFFTSQSYHKDYFERNLMEILYENRGCAGLLTFLSTLVEKYYDSFVTSTSGTKKSTYIEDILTYISENLSSTNLNETAAYFDLSPEYFCRLFKKSTGENYSIYIKKLKFDSALEILRSGEKTSIAEISAMLGFKSQSHFQNIFKKEFGISPDAYRKAIKKENHSS